MPSLRPEIGIKVITRKVDKLSCIRFGSARYSVPCRLIGSQVTITTTAAVLTVIAPLTGEVLAEHRLVGPGEVSIDDAHYDRPRPDKPDAGTTAENPSRERLLRVGSGRGCVPGRRRRGRGVQARQRAGRHPRPRAPPTVTTALLAALERAVTYRRWRAADIRSILATAGPPPPHDRPGSRSPTC